MKRLVVKKSSVWIPACAGIGLIGNELSNPLFVWCQFQIAPTLSFLGSDSAGLLVLFDERIDGRAADRVLENEVFDEQCQIIICAIGGNGF